MKCGQISEPETSLEECGRQLVQDESLDVVCVPGIPAHRGLNRRKITLALAF